MGDLEKKSVGGRPKKNFSDKVGKVVLYFPNSILLRYPADRIKREIIDLYNSDEELGMVSKSVKDVVKPNTLVEDKMAKARKALEMAESKQSLNHHQKNTIELFGKAIVNPYAHNKDGHQLCDRLFELVKSSGNNVDLIKKISGFFGELEDARDSGFWG